MADLNIIFGISGLAHPSLMNNFYPEDLPEDWRLDYYSNEFDALLCSDSDIELLDELQEMIEEKNFTCLLEKKAGLSLEQPEQVITVELSRVINSTDQDDGVQWVEAIIAQKDIGICLINKLQENTPRTIRELIETIQNYASQQSYSEVYVIFSDNHALENCRSALVIDAMM